MALGRALFVFLMLVPGALAAPQSKQSSVEVGRSTAGGYTIQVAAFPDEQSADRFAAFLGRMNEKPIWGLVDLESRGIWFRVFVGSFADPETARRYGRQLVVRGVVTEFLVKTADEIRLLGRPRTTYRAEPVPASGGGGTTDARGNRGGPNSALGQARPASQSSAVLSSRSAMPVRTGFNLDRAPRVDVRSIPRPSAIDSAFSYFAADSRSSPTAGGGLWIGGDVTEGLNRLRWIVGADMAKIVGVGANGKVQLNAELLARAAGAVSVDDPAACALVRELIASNEGLKLLVQVATGRHRYALHVGKTAPTSGGEVAVDGSINLDNNYDSRINPYRKTGAKLDRERPASGFDCLIAINPTAHWFNLHIGKLVPAGNITFHELAEAYGKVALGLQYLSTESLTGAHNWALEREVLLKSQRPDSENVVTVGSNRVFRSEDEARRFQAEYRMNLNDQH
jgi:hypothetical protein